MIKMITAPLKKLGLNSEEILAGAACILLIICGGFFNHSLYSPTYLLLQTQEAAFMGIIATGAMLVILLGHIDLSVPWNVAGTAILTTTLAGSLSPLSHFAIPIALLAGALIGLVNGVGVAIFRISSLVWTLAMNSILLGLSVFLTSGHKPRGVCPDILIALAQNKTLGIPNAFLIWMVLALIISFVLKKTVFGKYLYALGNSEKAAYLSGIRTNLVIIVTFIIAGILTAFGGQLRAGYVNQAYQGMGDSLVMPILASIVIGGTSILGGRGTYLGTILGVFFITLLSSILSVVQIPEAVRQIIFGSIIIIVLLLHHFRSSNQKPDKISETAEVTTRGQAQ